MPWLETIKLTQQWVDLDGDGSVAFVKAQLARGYYVHTSLDEFYLPDREASGFVAPVPRRDDLRL